jgi:hypothetical protein
LYAPKEKKPKQLPFFGATLTDDNLWSCSIKFEGETTEIDKPCKDRTEAEEKVAEILLAKLKERYPGNYS